MVRRVPAAVPVGTWCRSIVVKVVLASLVPERASGTPRSPHFENHRFRHLVESSGWSDAQSTQENQANAKTTVILIPVKTEVM